MNFSIKKLVLSLFAILFAAQLLSGQSQNPEELFDRGLILYRNNDFVKARENFIKLAELKESNPRETISLVMLAKSCFQLGDYKDAIRYAGRLIEDYPASSYVPYAYYERARAHVRLNNFKEAMENLTFTIEFAASNELKRLAESTATNMVDKIISLRQLEDIIKIYPWQNARPILTIWRAHLQFKNGQAKQANALLDEFLAAKPQNRYATIAKQLQNKESGVAKKQVKIGILQPTSGYFSLEANDFLRGVAFALDRRASGGAEIALIVKDTRGDIVETINSTLDIKNTDVQLVITDLEGEKAAASAGLLKSTGIPVIIPVATDNNLAKIDDLVFQFNNDMEMRGSALAEHAIQDLNMTTFATLAPADDYGNAITDAFANRVDELGGAIISQQLYYPGTTDFSPQLEMIREAGFRYSYRDTLRGQRRQSVMSSVDSMYTRFDRRARRQSGENTSLAKYTDISLRSIDGLFAPIYEEDIPYIASQYALFNIKARLLGGDTWNNPELLRRQQRYVNGVVYVAGFYFSETDLDYINFTRDFRIATGTSPGIMAQYGYNLMNLIIAAVDAGNTTSEQIADFLKNTDEFQALGTTISFDNTRRVNDFVNILHFQDGLIQRVNATD